ncbi:hypothetical protein Ait01nite_098760 [Actinoplanes italicus]|nr:RCC1 domain-containing protein [Actinoplanes italicus]GIE36831.1 hypothetical protein Ait01nite_098760 [Actinoplanes italicus]
MAGVAVMLAAVIAVPAAAQALDTPIVQLTAGGGHACGLGSDTRTYCWGRGAEGQLGDGRTTYRSSPVMVNTPAGASFTQLTAGQGHTCGLGSDAKTYCWGFGDYGQLGDGGTANRSNPGAVNLPAGVTLTQLTSGDRNTCGLGSDAKTYCWGIGNYGQLGNGGTPERSSPVAVSTPAGVSFTQLAGGINHTCALGSDTKAYCWGMGGKGQLGDGGTGIQSSPVAVNTPAGLTFTRLTAGGYHMCGLGSDAKAYCWGFGDHGQLGDGGNVNRSSPVAVTTPAGVTFTQLAAGSNHTCGLGSDTRTYCWGYGFYGQLGNGDTLKRSTPAEVTTPAGVTFTQLAAGWHFTCGLGSDTKAYCWGLNETSQLGDGGIANRSAPVAVSLTSSPGAPPPPANPPSAAPQPPAGVTVTTGNQQITVSWTAPSDLGDGTLTGYTVTVQPGGNSCTTVTTTCTITGLPEGMTYLITAVTTTTAGTSLAGNRYSGPPSRR